MNYYNDNDPKAAAWLRELIKQNAIPPGDVDERSITDVTKSDIAGYTQCHFFAGIGGWSEALRLAGVGPDVPLWTGSCPCQPFSCAGQRKGEKDSRHLWPEFRRLISECNPPIVFGEQVASKDGRVWLSGVRSDLENLGYAIGAADLCAAGVGAPHIRQRLYWVAESKSSEFEQRLSGKKSNRLGFTDRSEFCGLVDTEYTERWPELQQYELNRDNAGRDETASGIGACREDGRMGNPESQRRDTHGTHREGQQVGRPGADGGVGDTLRQSSQFDAGKLSSEEKGIGCQGFVNGDQLIGSEYAGSSLGFWSRSIWIPCADGKARRIEPESFPLADGIPGRVGLLRGYGNAIVPEVAAEFIKAYLNTIADIENQEGTNAKI